MSAVKLGPLRLPAPVMAAAGAGGFGPPPAGAADQLPPLGAVVTPGLAHRTRRGRAPRLVETVAGAVYHPGTAQLGVAEAVRRYARAWATSPSPVIVNLQATVGAEFPAAAAELEGVPGVAALELNLASVEDATGLPFAHQPALVRQLIGAVRRSCAHPILAKLPTDTPALTASLDACAAAGAVAVTLGAGLSLAEGYLVGPATFPIVLALVAGIAGEAPLPIIAAGGVGSAAHARRYLEAGAAAVQVGSACLADPLAAYRILEDALTP